MDDTQTHNEQETAGPPELKPVISHRHVSFGIEIEFVIPVIWEDEDDPEDADVAAELAPLLKLPTRLRSSSETSRPRSAWRVGERVERDYVRDTIRKSLADGGLPMSSINGLFFHDPESVPGIHADAPARDCTSWTVTSDNTVSEAFNFGGGAYRWMAVELVSPAFWDRRESFDMIRLALGVLTSSFRLRLNPTSGFHVHVGAGVRNRIDSRTLRKLGAFLWAASPLLSTLHAPERAFMDWSQSLRVKGSTELSRNRTDTVKRLWGEQEEEGPGPETCRRARLAARDRWLGEAYDLADDPFVRKLRWEMDSDIGEVGPLPLDLSCDTFGEPGRHPQDKPYMNPATNPDLQDDEYIDFPSPQFEPPSLLSEDDNADIASDLAWKLDMLNSRNTDRNPKPASAPPRPREPPVARLCARRYPPRDSSVLQDPAVQKRIDVYVAHRCIDPLKLAKKSSAMRHDVLSGVSEVLKSSFSGVLTAALYRPLTCDKHTAYNFASYESASYTSPYCLEDKCTVEFREAGASLDPVWVTTWARICCGLLKYCRDAADDEWIKVIRLMAWVQEERGPAKRRGHGEGENENESRSRSRSQSEGETEPDFGYDVVDLLIDIGLYAEASIAERRLSAGEAAWTECPTLPSMPAEQEKPPSDSSQLPQ